MHSRAPSPSQRNEDDSPSCLEFKRRKTLNFQKNKQAHSWRLHQYAARAIGTQKHKIPSWMRYGKRKKKKERKKQWRNTLFDQGYRFPQIYGNNNQIGCSCFLPTHLYRKFHQDLIISIVCNLFVAISMRRMRRFLCSWIKELDDPGVLLQK